MNSASAYDQAKGQYEIVALTPDRQLARAATMDVNSNTVNPPPPTAPTIANINRPPVVYPAYQCNYPAGNTIFRLPGNIADPAPMPNQHLHWSPHTYSMFTHQDLPAILFRIEPLEDTFKMADGNSIPVPILHNANTGQPVITSRGHQLRYFSFLPRYIPHGISGAIMEFWFRLDYRLEMHDITDRMENSLGLNADSAGFSNKLNMLRVRFREATGNFSWKVSRKWPARADVVFVGTLTPEQICLNTIMVVDITNRRFLKPVYANEQCTQKVGFMAAGIPSDYFLSNIITTVPSRRMVAGIALRWRLQDLAVAKGLGQEPESYRHLDKADDPPWWHDKQTAQQDGRQITELPGNYTHKEWMQLEIGENMNIGIAKRAATRRRRTRTEEK